MVQTDALRRSWRPRCRLILIGGGAGVGKSVVARELARKLGAGWLQLDTIWLALTDAAEPGSERRRTLDVDARLRHGDEPAASLLAAHIEAARLVGKALARPLRFELQAHGTVVADGAWLLPSAVRELDVRDTTVSAVFLHEAEFDQLRAAMESRRSSPMAAPWHDRSARLAWLYGNWPATEARRERLPLVASQPWETLTGRVRGELGLGEASKYRA